MAQNLSEKAVKSPSALIKQGATSKWHNWHICNPLGLSFLLAHTYLSQTMKYGLTSNYMNDETDGYPFISGAYTDLCQVHYEAILSQVEKIASVEGHLHP